MKEQQKIEQRAYALWEEEGRPDGRDMAHWLQAESEMRAPPAAKAPARRRTHPRAPTQAKAAK